jgi:hypothetical protein
MVLVLNILVHGTIFAVILTLYLLAVMLGFSPRIWAFSDYPKTITGQVDPQTKRERRIGIIVFFPFLIIGIAYPLLSTYILKALYGGVIPFLDAFLNVFAVWMFGFMADLLILDWLIVGTITPSWVIIPGTERMKKKEYKEFRMYHAKGHLKGLVALAGLSIVLALIVVFS